TVASEEQRAATAQLGLTAPMAGGFYQQPSVDGKALMRRAFNDPAYDLRTTAGHEAWHHAEMALATDAELRLIRSPDEMARTARLAAQELGRSIEEVRQRPDYEIRAIAFQRYRRLREEGAQLAGIHIGVRRLWDRIIRIFRAVRNVIAGRASLGQALAGAGSTEAIFEQARRGEFADRTPKLSAAARDVFFTNVLPSQPQPQLTPQAALGRQTRRTLSRAMNALDRARVLVQDRVLPVRRYQEQLETD